MHDLNFKVISLLPIAVTVNHALCKTLKWLWLVGMFCNHKMHTIWSVDSMILRKIITIVATMMSDFKAKMHQIVCRAREFWIWTIEVAMVESV